MDSLFERVDLKGGASGRLSVPLSLQFSRPSSFLRETSLDIQALFNRVSDLRQPASRDGSGFGQFDRGVSEVPVHGADSATGASVRAGRRTG